MSSGTTSLRTTVNRRARLHVDRSGDPLDGLVNLFDLAVVLAVAFLLSALTAAGGVAGDGLKILNRTSGATSGSTGSGSGSNGQPEVITPTDQQVTGAGVRLGGVYRLPDGRLVYVPGR